MLVYFLLIGYVLLIPIILARIEKSMKKRNIAILVLSLFGVFFVMSMRAHTVGIDTSSYKNIYELMSVQPWGRYNISWMESGYEILMMIFTHIFKVPFQVFIVFVYAFVFFSYGVFLKRYSEDYTLSLMLYICFTFFTFDASAVRTVIGIAICLFALPFAKKKGFWNFVAFLLITLLASQMHKSAYIFLLIYLIIKIPFNIKTAGIYIGVPFMLFLFRKRLITFVNANIREAEEKNIQISGNIIFYILAVVLTSLIFITYARENGFFNRTQYIKGRDNVLIQNYFDNNYIMIRILYFNIILQLLFYGTVLIRTAQYAQIFLIAFVPNNIKRLNKKDRIFIKSFLFVFLVWYFWKYSLSAPELSMVPYKFFWNL